MSREEADLLVSLGADVRAWYTGAKLLGGKLKLWAVAPWRCKYRRVARYDDVCFFVRDADGQA